MQLSPVTLDIQLKEKLAITIGQVLVLEALTVLCNPAGTIRQYKGISDLLALDALL